MSFRARWDQWRSGILAAAVRFPWNLLCGIAGAAAMIVMVHADSKADLEGLCARIAMTAAVGMPLFFSLRILRERSDNLRRWPIELIGLPLLALWFWTLPSQPDRGPWIVVVRWLLLLAALHCLAAISCCIRGHEGIGFWQFNRKLFLRFCLAALYAGVLAVGLELALLSANKLFDLEINNGYVDLFFFMAGVFQPAFFLGGVPSDFQALDADPDYPRGLKAFTQFALAPLVAVYTGILYAYTVKILVAHSWPHGWVALPVLLLSGIGILAFLLLSPLRFREGEAWAAWFTRNFPRALAPLSILLLLSLRVRIADYGITEERYLGVVAGFWVMAWAIVFIIRRQAGIRWIPYSLAIISLLCAFGPWSAGAVSRANQLQRVKQMLEAHGLWRDNQAAPSPTSLTLSDSDHTNLRTTLEYLIGTHGSVTIQEIFKSLPKQPDWKTTSAWNGSREILTALNISGSNSFETSSVTRAQDNAVDVRGFQRVWHLTRHAHTSVCNPSSDPNCTVEVWLEDGLLKITTTQDNSHQTLPLEPVLAKVESASDDPLPNSDLTVDFTHGTRTFRITFESLTWRRQPEGVRISTCEFFLLEK